MRYTYVRPFTDAAQVILEQVLFTPVETGEFELSPTTIVSRGVTTIIGITGEATGRVLIDLTPQSALQIAEAMNGEKLSELGELGRDTIAELTSMITGRALSILNDAGHRLKGSPPTLLMGENLTISNFELETLVVPLRTVFGELVVNVAIATS